MFGLDLSERMVQLAKKNLDEAGIARNGPAALRGCSATSLCGGDYGCGLHELYAGSF